MTFTITYYFWTAHFYKTYLDGGVTANAAFQNII